LIPLALILVTVIIWVFMWAIKSGQFDDLEGPAYQILQDDDRVKPEPKTLEKQKIEPPTSPDEG
jgi:cbb3-type cytochrome oxidase maturation protein